MAAPLVELDRRSPRGEGAGSARREPQCRLMYMSGLGDADDSFVLRRSLRRAAEHGGRARRAGDHESWFPDARYESGHRARKRDTRVKLRRAVATWPWRLENAWGKR